MLPLEGCLRCQQFMVNGTPYGQYQYGRLCSPWREALGAETLTAAASMSTKSEISAIMLGSKRVTCSRQLCQEIV